MRMLVKLPGPRPTTIPSSVLGLLCALQIPVQLALIVFAMVAFAQAWNVEMEVPKEEAEKRGYKFSTHAAAAA